MPEIQLENGLVAIAIVACVFLGIAAWASAREAYHRRWQITAIALALYDEARWVPLMAEFRKKDPWWNDLVTISKSGDRMATAKELATKWFNKVPLEKLTPHWETARSNM